LDGRTGGEVVASHLVPFRTETADKVEVRNCAVADKEECRVRSVPGEYLEHLGSASWGWAIIEGQRHQRLSGLDAPDDARHRPSERIEGPKRLCYDHCGARHEQAAKDEKRATHQSPFSHERRFALSVLHTPRLASRDTFMVHGGLGGSRSYKLIGLIVAGPQGPTMHKPLNKGDVSHAGKATARKMTSARAM